MVLVRVHRAALVFIAGAERPRGQELRQARVELAQDEREARELFDQAQYDYWGARDPIGMYETFLMEDHGVSETRLTAIESEVIEVLDDAARKAVSKLETHQPDPSTVSDGVYRDGPV